MAEALSIGGLASGLDTNAIIDGLSDLEQVKVRREVAKLEEIEDKKQAFEDLVTRVGTLSTKAGSLNDINNFNLYTSETNEDEIVSVSGGVDATEGTFEVEVLSLATSQKVSSGAFSAINTALGSAGKFEISKTREAVTNDPTKTTAEIEILSTDSLKDIASKINSTDGVGVSASILSVSDTDHRLILTAKDEGSDSFTLNELTGSVLGASGMGFIDDTQRVRSENNFVLQAGGAASASTTFSELSTGIGSNNLTNGDGIRIEGTQADGSAISAVDFSFNTTDTVQDMLTAIEGAFSNTVTASMNSSGEIELLDTSSGASTMSLSLSFLDNDSSGSTLQLGDSKSINNYKNVLSEGKKAFFKVDSLSFSAQGNTSDEIVQGTKFNLLKAEVGTIAKVTLKRDNSAIVDKIRGFVDEFNALVKYIDEKSKVTITEGDTEDGQQTVSKKGPLSGDSTVRRLRNELRSLMTAPIEELNSKTQYTSLSRIGITSSTSDGTLKIDDEDLTDAINADFDGVRRLFAASGWSDNSAHEMGRYTKDSETGTYVVDPDGETIEGNSATRIGIILTSKSGESKGLSVEAAGGSGLGNFTFVRGIASKLQQFYEQSNDFVDGLFKNTREGFDARIKAKEERVDRLQSQADNYRDRLIKEFSSLEQSMSRLQSQSSAFLSQIGAL